MGGGVFLSRSHSLLQLAMTDSTSQHPNPKNPSKRGGPTLRSAAPNEGILLGPGSQSAGQGTGVAPQRLTTGSSQEPELVPESVPESVPQLAPTKGPRPIGTGHPAHIDELQGPQQALDPSTDLEPSDHDWTALHPSGGYARIGRPLLNGLLLIVSLPVVLCLLPPLWIINAILVRSFRHAIFCQTRIGKRGQPFTLYKLCTMTPAAGSEGEHWRNGDEGRVTPFGRFLRRTHLDELPQLLNILRGEMTFIGPRPEMVEAHEFGCRAVPEFGRRNALRPGITGLAQVTAGYAGHDAHMYQRKYELDESYRLSYSLRGDLGILLRTGMWVMRMRGWRNDAQQAEKPSTPHPA